MAKRFAWTKNVRLGERGLACAWLREEITAKQSARILLKDEATLPGMRQMRGVEPLHRVLTKRKDLPISKGSRRAIGEIAD